MSSLGFFCQTAACADVAVIYRKTDRAVVGWVYPPHSVEREIKNITRSELGGQPDDYATAPVPEARWTARGNNRVAVDAAGEVIFAPDPACQQKDAARRSARAKLSALGLTDEEISALIEP